MPQPRQQTGKSSGWRGARPTAQKPHVAHKWEAGAQSAGATGSRATTGRVGRRIAALTALALICLAWFVWSILFAPPQTPVVLVTMDSPHPDLPPNGWVREDFERIQLLHRETLHVLDSSPEWHSSSDGLRDLETRLSELARHARHGTAVVVYISMHAAVRDDGIPCLLAIGPGVSPLDTTTWLPVAELLQSVERAGFPDDVCKLIVLDCGDMRVNWSAGVLYNTFADRLGDAVADASTPNLVVLNATSPGERAWDSEDLRGSVFGWFFQRGIAGAADDRAEGGNGDRRVSLAELVAYLQSRVDSWVWFNRGERQRPMVMAPNVPDVEVAWALRPSARARLSRAAGEIGLARIPHEAELLPLWEHYDALRNREMATTQPLQVARLLRSLQRLEEAMSAGAAYAPLVVAARADVEHQLSLLEDGPYTDSRAAGLGAVRFQNAGSIAMARVFESSTVDAVTNASELLEKIAGDDDDASIDTDRQALERDPRLRRFVEVHFLRLLQRYGIQDPATVRAAVRTRRLAERAAAPRDVRAFAAVADRDPDQPDLWSDVEAADALRLAREDDLLAGIAVSSEQWKPIDAVYSRVIAESGDRAAILATRDRILSELPYLAHWLCRVSANTEQRADADASVTGPLKEVITTIYPVNQEDLLLDTRAHQLQSDFNALRQSFDREYLRLLRPEDASGERVRDALELLSCPLLPAATDADGRTPAEQRMALRSRARSMAAERNAQWDPDLAAPDIPETRSPFLQRIESEWIRHPLELMLADHDRQPLEGELLARHARREQFVRLKLATIPHQLEPGLLVGREQPTPPESRQLRQRSAWSQAECLARIVAPLAPGPFDFDPVLELRTRDLSRLLLWQTKRMLIDCYGPAADGETPFATDAAAAYLTAARDLTDERSLTGTPGADLQQRLQDLTIAARQGIDVAASDVIVIGGRGEVSVIVRRGTRSDAFPEGGRAAVFLNTLDAAAGPAPTIPLPLPDDEDETLRLPITMESATEPAAEECLVMFRGHQFARPFQAIPLEGTVSTFKPGHPDHADVTVLGPGRKRPQVMFVLDCSASMQQPVSLEAAPSRRFDVARLALELLMRELAEDETFRVGMVLFGHRARWDQQDRSLVRSQVEYGRPIPPGQMPYDDVETVLPLGRFDSSIAANLFDELGTTMPWGESPLYAALLNAIRELPDEAGAGEQFIVVITDGLNHQFGAPGGQVKQAADVLQALADRPARINVVGFDVPPEEAAEAQRVYDSLTLASNGRYTPIGESGRLLDYLRSLFSQEQFDVDRVGRTTQSADVGTTLRIRSIPPEGESLRVGAADATTSIALEGGEAVRLLLSPDGTQLTAEPYLDGNPTFVPLMGGGNARSLTLGVHRPIRRGTTVEFEFSIQSSDGKQPPRPTTAWIELTPVTPTGVRSRPYTFYDRSFADGTSVPILTWSADDWPDDATRAEVKFWCRFDTLDPDLDEPPGATGDGPVHRDGPAGATLTITHDAAAGELVVVEQYRAAPAEFPGLHVNLTGSRTVAEVVREFDREHSAAIHRFRLAAGSDEMRLQATGRDRIESGAWQLARPVLVDVAVSDGLILPAPPP